MKRPDRFSRNLARFASLSARGLRWTRATLKPVRSEFVDVVASEGSVESLPPFAPPQGRFAGRADIQVHAAGRRPVESLLAVSFVRVR
jgi:hypothetical protein